jgi:hypothetical protein
MGECLSGNSLIHLSVDPGHPVPYFFDLRPIGPEEPLRQWLEPRPTKKAPTGATTRTDEASWPGSGRLHERIENGGIILAIREDVKPRLTIGPRSIRTRSDRGKSPTRRSRRSLSDRLAQVIRRLLDNSPATCHDPVMVAVEWSGCDLAASVRCGSCSETTGLAFSRSRGAVSSNRSPRPRLKAPAWG